MHDAAVPTGAGVSSGAQAARVVIRAAAATTARGVARLDMEDSLEKSRRLSIEFPITLIGNLDIKPMALVRLSAVNQTHAWRVILPCQPS
ncbi:hypothetical protein Asi02nite_09180 [Asanoa siamensis]|uniref:Uncharacterized protein n=1 Tax=Asanoa siamensis TaxID=926357 RepID=A0ABQ4CJD0_9ACTN|nr:hypothetical protein Asi02nite_09180 [Asanoa siamensis]